MFQKVNTIALLLKKKKVRCQFGVRQWKILQDTQQIKKLQWDNIIKTSNNND